MKKVKIIEKILVVIAFIGILFGSGIIFCYFHIDDYSMLEFGNKKVIFNYSDKMDPDIKVNDVVIVDVVDLEELAVNNIIAYKDNNIYFARIIDGVTNQDRSYYEFDIKQNTSNKTAKIKGDNVVGKYNYYKLTNCSDLILFLLSGTSFVIFTILPIFIYFTYEVVLLAIDIITSKSK